MAPVQESDDDMGDYQAVPAEEPDEEQAHGEEWTEEEWKAWRKKQWKEYYEDSSSGEDLPWDELQVEEIQVLPDEVLGWLLLRRASLSASSRLSVQASVNNSLKFQDIELALRDQEEELLQADNARGGGQHHKRRSYWVEEEGTWGLLAAVPDDMDEQAEIHWVGSQLPAEVYDPGTNAENYEDEEVFWTWETDGYHGYVPDGYGYWPETDGYGTYWSADEPALDLTPEENKELEEAYAIYENKARTFMQSRQLQRAKGASRGFYPLTMMKGGGRKGKSKGKGKKGKGFGHPMTSSTSSTSSKPLFAAQGAEGSTTTTSSGCFICGDKGHGFRQCPKRSSSSTASSGKGSKKGTFWVETLNASSLAFIGMVTAMNEMVYDTSGFGVLDLGATETVGSLEALEALMAMRSHIHGNSEPVEVFTGPSSKKPFRFGNGGVQFSSSYVLVPQRLGEQLVMLGLYTIDAEKVPILIGMKTLVKLGAVIDVYGQWMVLSHVSPEVKIPLAKSKAGHLLVNLTMDWLNVSQPLQSSANDGAYMASAATVDVEQASGGLSRSLDLDFHETSVMPSVSCCLDGVGDVWMIEDDEEEMQDDDMPADDVFLMDQHHAHQPLPSATQEMRDRILQQLVTPNTNSDPRLLSNGSQDGFNREQGQQSEGSSSPDCGEVRLGPHSRSRSPGRAHSGQSLLWESRGTASGQRFNQWLQSMGAVDGMRGVWSSPVLHTDMGQPRDDPSRRSTMPGCSSTVGDQEAGEGQRGVEQQEDLLRRSGAIFGAEAGQCQVQEGGVAADASQTPHGQDGGAPQGLPQGQVGRGEGQGGDVNREHAAHGRAAAPDRRARVFGPSACGIRYNAFGEPLRRERRILRIPGEGGGHEQDTGPEVPQADGTIRGVGLQPAGHGQHQRGGRPVDSDVRIATGVNVAKDTTAVSRAWNSTPNPFPAASPTADSKRTEEGNSFTTDGILPSDASSGGKRKNTADGDEVFTVNLDAEETAFLVQELDKQSSEIDELFIALKACDPSGRPPTVLELCCEEDSGLTKALEKLGVEASDVDFIMDATLTRKVASTR